MIFAGNAARKEQPFSNYLAMRSASKIPAIQDPAPLGLRKAGRVDHKREEQSKHKKRRNQSQNNRKRLATFQGSLCDCALNRPILQHWMIDAGAETVVDNEAQAFMSKLVRRGHSLANGTERESVAELRNI